MSDNLIHVEHLKKYYNGEAIKALDDAVSYTHLTLPTKA